MQIFVCLESDAGRFFHPDSFVSLAAGCHVLIHGTQGLGPETNGPPMELGINSQAGSTNKRTLWPAVGGQASKSNRPNGPAVSPCWPPSLMDGRQTTATLAVDCKHFQNRPRPHEVGQCRVCSTDNSCAQTRGDAALCLHAKLKLDLITRHMLNTHLTPKEQNTSLASDLQ